MSYDKEYQRLYFQKNKKRIAKYRKSYDIAYYKAHKAKIDKYKKAYYKKYYQDNKEQLNARYKIYCKNNRALINEISRKYRKNHPEYFKIKDHKNYVRNRTKILERQKVYRANKKNKISPR